MKYFTPELYLRGNSSDDDALKGIEAEWERAILRYHRRLEKIKALFPPAWHQFRANHVCLHDAQVLSMAQQGETFAIVVRKEPPSHELVILTFALHGDPCIDRAVLPDRQERRSVEWLYEEWDVDRHQRCCFEVLLSNGWGVKLHFRDFQFLIAQQLLPVRPGPTSEASPVAVPRSA